MAFGSIRHAVTRAGLAPVEKRRQTQRLGLVLLIVLVVVSGSGWYAQRRWSRHHAETARYPAPPDGMVLVPAGTFTMGTDDPAAYAAERPARPVWLPAYYIDVHEVTNAQYANVVRDHDYAPDDADKPVTGISKAEATAYAHAVGKRLPSGAEWERAARGTDGRIYPWGNHFASGLAHVTTADWAVDGKSRVGRYPGGVSPAGCFDMAGNAWEWVSDDYIGPTFFGLEDPVVNEIIRGGGYNYRPFQLTTFHMGFEPVGGRCNDTGFRCARDAKAE